jgi:hypothetical protein
MIYVGPFCFVGVVLVVDEDSDEVERAGGSVGDVLLGEEGVEVDVGDIGRVWGENVIDCVGGESRVVEVVIWTMSVSIYRSALYT